MLTVDGTRGGEPGQRFNYLFYLDFIGKLSEEKVQNAMRHLQVRGGRGRCEVRGGRCDARGGSGGVRMRYIKQCGITCR